VQTSSECEAFDRADPLRSFRDRFARPATADGVDELVYLCGHSLGLMPLDAREEVSSVLDAWGALGVAGHFDGDDPWYRYDDELVPSMAMMVGADRREVALMGTLTANLHLLFASFFQPHGRRTKILIEATAFPSDRYAVAAQLRWHGLEPAEHLIEVAPDAIGLYGIERFRAVLDAHGDEIALVWVGAVNYLTGEVLDVPSLVEAGHRAGCVVGLDLAHAAGNIDLRLHDWDVDFAVWCNYKYLNGGPGAVAGIFVHDRHGNDPHRLRLAGWWGNDPATRFEMPSDFVPYAGAAGWRVSNPPILSLAPLRASLALFSAAGAERLRAKAHALSTHVIEQVSTIAALEVLTPRDPRRRGNQVSIRVPGNATAFERALRDHGIVVDVRPPDVIRVAAAPLYNSAHDVWVLTERLRSLSE